MNGAPRRLSLLLVTHGRRRGRNGQGGGKRQPLGIALDRCPKGDPTLPDSERAAACWLVPGT